MPTTQSPFARNIIICLAVVTLAGCNKAGDTQSAQILDSEAQAAADEAAAVARAAQAHLSTSMSDDEILRAIGADPAKLKLTRTDVGNGYIASYTNETTNIELTRSASAGISVSRMKPTDQQGKWFVKPKSP
jgi:hypothetical protein